MLKCVDLAVTCFLVWVYLQTIWVLLVNLLYVSVPWIIWGTIILHILIKFVARIPPPDPSAVKKVIGVDPLSLVQTEDGNIEDDGEQFCMRSVAHRGAGYDYPENSMAAFHNSREKGCDGVEFDLALTKDNIPILFHDVSIDRLTGYDGYIKDMTWNELKDYDISVNHPLRIKFNPQGEKIALFEEAIQHFLEHGQCMFIDIKGSSNEIMKVILDAYAKYPKLYEKAAITSFNPVVIYMIRKKDPRIVAGLGWRPKIFSNDEYTGSNGPQKARFSNLLRNFLAIIIDVVHDWALEHITYYVLGLSFILLQKDVISPEVVRMWNERGVRVIAWTVNLPTEKIHFARNLKVTYLTDTLLS